MATILQKKISFVDVLEFVYMFQCSLSEFVVIAVNLEESVTKC